MSKNALRNKKKREKQKEKKAAEGSQSADGSWLKAAVLLSALLDGKTWKKVHVSKSRPSLKNHKCFARFWVQNYFSGGTWLFGHL